MQIKAKIYTLAWDLREAWIKGGDSVIGDMPYAMGTRDRLDRGGLEGVAYSEKGWPQVLDL